MGFGRAGARVDVEFTADTGKATADVKQFESVYQRTTAQLSNDALRMQVAQEKLNRTIARSGPESTQAKQATLAYRREVEALEREANQAARALDRDQRELGQLTRGAVAGTGVLHGYTRSLAFLSAGFLGSAGVVAGFRSAIGAASDLNEQTAKGQQVFGAAADQVLAWGKTTANAIGIADDKALEAAGTFGNLFNTVQLLPAKNAELSRSLVELAADLASFNNASPEETLEALRSGVIGEAEPLRRFGVLLSEARVKQEALRESGKKNADQLTDQEKLLARVAIIFRDTTKAQGDFARTSDGTANQQREANANLRDTAAALGQELEPAYNHVLHTVNAWLGSSQNQKRLQKDVNAIVRDGTQVAHGLAKGIDGIRAVLGPVIEGLGGLEHAAETALIVGLLAKARRSAASFGLIRSASAATRTQVVADANAEAAAVGRVGAAAQTAGGRIRGIFGGGRGGRAALGGAGTLALLGSDQIGGNGGETVSHLGLAAILAAAGQPELALAYLGITESDRIKHAFVDDATAETVAGANGSPFPKGSPLDAQYQQIYKNAPKLQDASDRGTSAQRYSLAPLPLAAGRASIGAPPLTAAQQLAIGYARAQTTTSTTDDVAVLREQEAREKAAVEFAEKRIRERRGDTAKLAQQLENHLNELASIQGRLASIAEQKAQAAKTAREKREAARAQMIADLIPNTIRSTDDVDPKLLVGLQLAAGREIGAALVPGRVYRADATPGTTAAVARFRQGRLDIDLARIDNRALAARLTKTLSDDRQANQLLIDFWRRRTQEAKKGTLEREQARSQWLQALQARQAYAGGATSGMTAAEFFAEAANEVRTYGSNIGAAGYPLAGQDGRALVGLLSEVVRLTREGNRHARTTATGTTTLVRGHRTPADEARLAAIHGY